MLISSPKAVLGTEGSQLFSRYMVALTLQAAFERLTIKRDTWHPALLVIDEAQDVMDEVKTQELLQQARQFKLGVTVAHQQIRPQLTEAGFPNLTVLFTTTTKLRMENMIELLASMTADRKLLACFGFTLFPTILQGNQPDKGWAAKPWARVHETLTLGETDGTTATHQGTRRTEAENRPGAR